MFDFPNSPTNGQTVTGAGGIVYTWDGVKWKAAASGGGATGVSSFNTRTGAVTLTTTDVTAVADSTYVNVSGDTMTGKLTLQDIVQAGAGTGAGGYTQVNGGDATHTGYIAFFDAAGVRQGYLGYASAGVMQFPMEADTTTLNVGGNLNVSGNHNVTSRLGLGYGMSVWADATNDFLAWANNSYLIFTRATEYFGFNINSYGDVLNFASGIWRFPTGRIMCSIPTNNPSITCQVPGSYAAGMYLNVGDSCLYFGGVDGNGVPVVNFMSLQYANSYLNLPSWNTAYKNGGGTWSDNSDARIKRNVEDYKAGVAEIIKLRPITYEYNGLGEMPDTGTRYHGFIAQEAMTVMPEMVGTRAAKLDPKDADSTDLLTVNITPMIFALVNAVKELLARIEALETRIA